MKFTFPVTLLATLACWACAEITPSFAKRIELARNLEQQPAIREYIERNLFPIMGSSMSEVMRSCLAQPNASTASFTLVANVAQEGAITDVEYDPPTNTAQCFVNTFRTLRLPSPPPKSERGYLPIFIELTFTE